MARFVHMLCYFCGEQGDYLAVESFVGVVYILWALALYNDSRLAEYFDRFSGVTDRSVFVWTVKMWTKFAEIICGHCG